MGAALQAEDQQPLNPDQDSRDVDLQALLGQLTASQDQQAAPAAKSAARPSMFCFDPADVRKATAEVRVRNRAPCLTMRITCMCTRPALQACLVGTQAACLTVQGPVGAMRKRKLHAEIQRKWIAGKLCVCGAAVVHGTGWHGGSEDSRGHAKQQHPLFCIRA